jgi:hypothetical protein
MQAFESTKVIIYENIKIYHSTNLLFAIINKKYNMITFCVFFLLFFVIISAKQIKYSLLTEHKFYQRKKSEFF